MFDALSDWYDMGCIMIYGDCSAFNNEQAHIDADFFETTAHITVLYGIPCSVDTDDVIKCIEDFNFDDDSLWSDQIDIFQNSQQNDVVKFTINTTPKLLGFRKHLMDNLRNEQTYDVYNPHITLAYVKEGTGHKYIKKLNNSVEFIPKRIVYCPPCLPGEIKEINIPFKWNEYL